MKRVEQADLTDDQLRRVEEIERQLEEHFDSGATRFEIDLNDIREDDGFSEIVWLEVVARAKHAHYIVDHRGAIIVIQTPARL